MGKMSGFSEVWKRAFKIIVIFVVALGILSLGLLVCTYFACKDLDKNAGKDFANNQNANPQKTLNIAYKENVGALNPQGYNKNAMFAQNLLYEGLVRVGKNGEIIPALATSWSVDKDGQIYTFSLREGVRFSNGEEFNADAVVLNFTSILQNRARHSWSGLARHIERVEKLDDYGVRLVLNAPYAPTLSELALVRPYRFLAPKAFPPDLDLVKHNPQPIGTGAYMLIESKLGAFDTFAKNPHYWDAQRLQNEGGFYYDFVRIKVIFEPTSKMTALRAGQVDMLYGYDEIPTRIFQEAMEQSAQKSMGESQNTAGNPPAIKAYLGGEAFVLSLMLNSTRLDSRLREAIALSIDKPTLINAVYGELASPANCIFLYTDFIPSPVARAGLERGYDSLKSSLQPSKDSVAIHNFCRPTQCEVSKNGGNICHTEALQKAEVSQISNNRDFLLATQTQNDNANIARKINAPNSEFKPKSTNLTPAQYSQNLQKAREILATLGYTQANPLTLEIAFAGDKPSQKMLSQILQSQLKHANIALSLRALEPSMLQNRKKNGEFDIVFNESWGAPYEPLSMLVSYTTPTGHGDFIAQSGLENKNEIDALILRVVAEPNAQKAQILSHKALDLLLQSGVYIPLAIERNKAIARSQIKGVEGVSGLSYEIPVWEFWE
ncbi:ABC transporter substrate-binding protein [Helicobacter sp. T3_23-1059]